MTLLKVNVSSLIYLVYDEYEYRSGTNFWLHLVMIQVSVSQSVICYQRMRKDFLGTRHNAELTHLRYKMPKAIASFENTFNLMVF